MARHRPVIHWEVAGLFQERILEWQIHFGALLSERGRQSLYRNAVGHIIVDNSNGAYSELTRRQPVTARLLVDGVVAWSGICYPEGGPETLDSLRLRWELGSQSAGALDQHVEVVSSAATVKLQDIRDIWQNRSGLTLAGAIPADIMVGPMQWSGRASRMLDGIAAYGSGWVMERFNGTPYFAHHATLKASTKARTLGRDYRPLALLTRLASNARSFGGRGRFQALAVQASAEKELASKPVTFAAGALTRRVSLIVRNEVFVVVNTFTASQSGSVIAGVTVADIRQRRREAAGAAFDYISAEITVPSAGTYDIAATGSTGEIALGAVAEASVSAVGIDGFTVPDMEFPPWYPLDADGDVDSTMAAQASAWVALIAGGLARGRLAYPLIQPLGQVKDLVTISPGEAIQAETAGFWRLWLVLAVTLQGGRDQGGRLFLDVVELGELMQGTEPVGNFPFPPKPRIDVDTKDTENDQVCLILPEPDKRWDIFRAPQGLWQFRPSEIKTVATNIAGGTKWCEVPGTGTWDYRICPTGERVDGDGCSAWNFTTTGPDHGDPTPTELRFTLTIVELSTGSQGVRIQWQSGTAINIQRAPSGERASLAQIIQANIVGTGPVGFPVFDDDPGVGAWDYRIQREGVWSDWQTITVTLPAIPAPTLTLVDR